MWTIGGADRLRFPRFPSKLEKRGNACLRPYTHRPRQQGELIIDDSKNHTRPAERTNGSTSNHLTPKAPYKLALAEGGGKKDRYVILSPNLLELLRDWWRVARALCRQTSKVGAGCGNAARPVLCGGCPVMGIPTAIIMPNANQ